ncbi:MAG TPA: HD domain-containing phosphohydrolase [Nitrospirota bacterium]|nr:HD domain-containing phosphohydrolase [Nitrospirota bacterium]
MTETTRVMHTCPNCGMPIEEDRYVKRRDGTYRCEHCYFADTYLDGIVQRMETGYLVTLEALVSAIDAREHEVGSHSLRVTEFALVIGNAFGMRGRDLVDLYCGSLLHDIGKIGVPDAVLMKAGPLDPAELAAMQKHPEIGYRIIGHIGYFSRAAEIIRCHHEHFDGSGYPRGLKGEEIPAGARVFAVADALDALTVTRPYHKAVPFDEAAEVITAASGTRYDPAVIEAFWKASAELREYIGRIFIDMEESLQDDLSGMIG